MLVNLNAVITIHCKTFFLYCFIQKRRLIQKAPPPPICLPPLVYMHVRAHLCANAVFSPIRVDWEKS